MITHCREAIGVAVLRHTQRADEALRAQICHKDDFDLDLSRECRVFHYKSLMTITKILTLLGHWNRSKSESYL